MIRVPKKVRAAAIASTLLLSFSATAAESEKPAPSVEQQLASLEQMCAASSEARDARHGAEPLFERLGGQAKVHELTREVVRLHGENPKIDHYVEHVDRGQLAERVAQFIISGTGGPKVYAGPPLDESHAHLKLTNADFLAAGGDVIEAMENLGHAQDEIDEIVCILVSLRHLVVIPEDVKLSSAQ